MAVSNKFGEMVVTTGNKSEMSVGYSTLYGDMCGGYSVLKDIYKTEVYALARWRNANRPPARSGLRVARYRSRPSAKRRLPNSSQIRRTRTRSLPMRSSIRS
jgi:NAD+ synthase